MILALIHGGLLGASVWLSVALLDAWRRAVPPRHPRAEAIGLGAVTNFFDTLGIGSFAPTTAWIKFRNLLPDTLLPGTLNAGHALPTIVQAAVFIGIIAVDPLLLAACIVAATVGAVTGAGVVARMPLNAIRFARVRVRAANDNRARAEQWLLIGRPAAETEPLHYWLSTLPESTSFKTLVANAMGRWMIERDYQQLKSEVGLESLRRA